MCLTIGRPGSSSQAAGCTLSCGQSHHSSAGAATVLRVPAPPVQSSGTSTPQKQDLTSSASCLLSAAASSSDDLLLRKDPHCHSWGEGRVKEEKVKSEREWEWKQ